MLVRNLQVKANSDLDINFEEDLQKIMEVSENFFAQEAVLIRINGHSNLLKEKSD